MAVMLSAVDLLYSTFAVVLIVFCYSVVLYALAILPAILLFYLLYCFVTCCIALLPAVLPFACCRKRSIPR